VFFRRPPGTDRYQGSTFNLSAGGLFVDTQTLFPRDSLLDIELDLSSSGNRLCNVGPRVAWINHPEWINKPLLPSGMGLELIDSPLDTMARLESVVSGVLSCTAESRPEGVLR
jgi:Tfp pilus assembly protein PilZ